jgi:pilus assembly protein Flp/PilA
MKLYKSIRQFIASEEATTAVEYAVLLAMILVAIIIGVTQAGGGVSAWWGNIRTDLDSYGT